MGLSFDKYLEKENDEYIQKFFNILNRLLKSTLEVHRSSLERNPGEFKFLEQDIVFLLKSMTSHYQFTEKHKKKLQIVSYKDKDSGNISWEFFYNEDHVFSLPDQLHFTRSLEVLENILYMDNPNFGRFYFERVFQLPDFHVIEEDPEIEISTMDKKICNYVAFGSRNIRIKDLINFFGVSLKNIKYYFWFRGIKKYQTFDYTEEEIEEFKDYLNWVHVLMYYKKVNTSFTTKYRYQIISFLTNELHFSSEYQEKAISYFLIQNKYLSINLKINIMVNNLFDEKFLDEFGQGVIKMVSESNQFLYTSDMNAFYYVETMNQEMAKSAVFEPGEFCIKMSPSRNIYLPYRNNIPESLKNYKNLSKEKIEFLFPTSCYNRFTGYETSFFGDSARLSYSMYINDFENRSVSDGRTPLYIPNTIHTFRSLERFRSSLTYSRQYILDNFGVDDLLNKHKYCPGLGSFGHNHMRDKFLCNFSSGRDKFLERIILKFVSANRIQRWWKKIYFNPNHSVGAKVMERVWEESKDLI